jgi:hypothetical protein
MWLAPAAASIEIVSVADSVINAACAAVAA